VKPATRALLATLVAVAVVATGCTGVRHVERTEEPTGTPQWRVCPDLPGEVIGHLVPPGFVRQLTEGVTYHCTTITVPRDWSDPGGATFDIALVRARAETQHDRIGSLVLNPGGPGASGVDLAVYLSFGSQFGGLGRDILDRFDLVGFDPRGVQRSSPVECFSPDDLDASFAAEPDPATPAEIEAVLAISARMAAGCEDRYGDTLRLYSTHQTARDLDAIRAAVGDDQLTYLGFSYGSLLGAVYAHLFPDAVRAMVLDGAVDATASRIDRSRGQAEGFELAFDNFTEWCRQHPGDCPLAGGARTAVTAALDDARESPAVGDDGREATSGWIFYAVIGALYRQDSWPLLGAAIDQLAGGDPTGVFDLADSYLNRSADGTYPNLWEANTAVNCADRADPPLTVAQARQLQEQWREELPLFGGPVALGALGCVHWPAEPDPYPAGPAAGAPPILVVGTTGDPATPYESTAALADLLGVGMVLTYDGEGHTAYPENPCIAGHVDAYLVDLTVPTAGTVCD
jgi:pimeloyl-ACP methyl ester carboxylesterase